MLIKHASLKPQVCYNLKGSGPKQFSSAKETEIFLNFNKILVNANAERNKWSQFCARENLKAFTALQEYGEFESEPVFLLRKIKLFFGSHYKELNAFIFCGEKNKTMDSASQAEESFAQEAINEGNFLVCKKLFYVKTEYGYKKMNALIANTQDCEKGLELSRHIKKGFLYQILTDTNQIDPEHPYSITEFIEYDPINNIFLNHGDCFDLDESKKSKFKMEFLKGNFLILDEYKLAKTRLGGNVYGEVDAFLFGTKDISKVMLLMLQTHKNLAKAKL